MWIWVWWHQTVAVGSNYQKRPMEIVFSLYMYARVPVCIPQSVHECVSACAHVCICRGQRKALDVLCQSLLCGREAWPVSHGTRRSSPLWDALVISGSLFSTADGESRAHAARPCETAISKLADLCCLRLEATQQDAFSPDVLFVRNRPRSPMLCGCQELPMVILWWWFTAVNLEAESQLTRTPGNKTHWPLALAQSVIFWCLPYL